MHSTTVGLWLEGAGLLALTHRLDGRGVIRYKPRTKGSLCRGDGSAPVRVGDLALVQGGEQVLDHRRPRRVGRRLLRNHGPKGESVDRARCTLILYRSCVRWSVRLEGGHARGQARERHLGLSPLRAVRSMCSDSILIETPDLAVTHSEQASGDHSCADPLAHRWSRHPENVTGLRCADLAHMHHGKTFRRFSHLRERRNRSCQCLDGYSFRGSKEAGPSGPPR